MNDLYMRLSRWVRVRLLVVVVTATAGIGICLGVSLCFYLLNRPTGVPPRTVVVDFGA